MEGRFIESPRKSWEERFRQRQQHARFMAGLMVHRGARDIDPARPLAEQLREIRAERNARKRARRARS